MTDYDLVMFDLDGTLVATAAEILDAVNDTLWHAGLPPVAHEQVERWIGHGTRELLAQAFAFAAGVAVDRVRTSELFHGALAAFDGDYERRCGTRSWLYPHVREVLKDLGRRGVRRAIVTNKEQRFTVSVLRRHALRGLVDHVVCGDTLPAKKPDPAGVLDCLRSLGVPRERALFIGDSSIDVATARNAGVPIWALTYGYNMGAPIAASAPDRLLDDLRPLVEEATA
ncbi:MAG: HAD-IA family hydrolase [Burkholderiales bacterium]|nr:HAD-IA family hydrolase [Burkholderiales bacterium]